AAGEASVLPKGGVRGIVAPRPYANLTGADPLVSLLKARPHRFRLRPHSLETSMLKHALITALFVAVAAGPALGQEKKITVSDLPAAVRQTADAQSNGATVRGYSRETEHGRVQYEVELMVAGKSRDVTIGADGTVLEVE